LRKVQKAFQEKERPSMSDLVQLTKDNGIAVITINNPPVNALSPGVPEGIAAALELIDRDDSVKAAVLIGGGKTFVAGADIKEFGKITSGKSGGGLELPSLLLKIEDCPKPVVMAIHGSAFGGGLELAMSGHYRVAVPSAQVGQPEVKLGIIPGAAGTQRLPRLAGAGKAVEMCSEGNPSKAAEALKFGIIDRLIEGDLLTGAVAFARDIADKPVRKTRERNDKLGSADENAAIFAGARENARKKQRGMIAPLAAIDAVEAATKLPFEEGSKLERKLFLDCLFSDQSKALIHVFFEGDCTHSGEHGRRRGRGNDGRRHRHGFGKRRHPRSPERSRPSRTRQRPGEHSEELRDLRETRPPHSIIR
jgi:3-hydroxyacyl-CoA dehydrogenase